MFTGSSLRRSLQAHQAGDAQMQELGLQQTVGVTCTRTERGGSRRNEDTQVGKPWVWFLVQGGIQDDTFLENGRRNDENVFQDGPTFDRLIGLERNLKVACWRKQPRMKRKTLLVPSRG